MNPYIDDQDVKVYVGDALTVLRALDDESVDCVVTSPPYWGLRDYGAEGQLGLEPTPQEYVENMRNVFREVRRVLTPHGTLWLNLGDSYITQTGKGSNVPQTKHPRNNYPEQAAHRSRAIPGLKPKDLAGMPWRVAFALQDDGWWLRSDIVWSKVNPMPESIRDRPTKSHEYIFFLTKSAKYFFDQEAVREPHTSTRWGGPVITQPETTKYAKGTKDGFAGAASALSRPGREWNAYPEGGRNIRTVWEITTQPFPGAHFATFPEELALRCILAGCPQQVCRTCGKPQERIVERIESGYDGSVYGERAVEATGGAIAGGTAKSTLGSSGGRLTADHADVGWTDCGHGDYRRGVVLDPFAGSGTTLFVARNHGRHAIGIELSEEYVRKHISERLAQQSLLT